MSGDAYECGSPNNDMLWKIYADTCRKHGILYRPDDVFGYLHKFEEKQRQLSLYGEA